MLQPTGGMIEEVEVLKEWANIQVNKESVDDVPEFIKMLFARLMLRMAIVCLYLHFKGREDGTWDAGTTKYEKRGVAVSVPV